MQRQYCTPYFSCFLGWRCGLVAKCRSPLRDKKNNGLYMPKGEE